MPGHGSSPPADRGRAPSRVVTRQSGMRYQRWELPSAPGTKTIHEVSEYRPEMGEKRPMSDTGTRFRYNVLQTNVGGSVWSNRSGDVRTMQRARWAAGAQGRRLGTKYLGG
jgi:hypothetical protein